MKRIVVIFLAILFGLLLNSQPTYAQQIYKWVDEKGTTHYSEDPNTVPEKYKNKVEKKDIDEFPLLLPDKPKSKSIDQAIVEKPQGPRGECEIIAFSQYEVSLGRTIASEQGTMSVSGNKGNYHGTTTYSDPKEVCLNLTIRNNDRETKEITETNVVATTSKRIGTRDTFNPKPFSMRIRPGETSQLSVCFGRNLGSILKVELRGL